MADFHERGALVVALNALIGLPSVVDVLINLVLSRSGPIGAYGLLFSPAAWAVLQRELHWRIARSLILLLALLAGMTHARKPWSSPSTPARDSTLAAAAMPTSCSSMIAPPKTSSSPTTTAATARM